MEDRDERMEELEPEHMRKVFIGGLHPDTTDESLKAHFGKYGKIVDVIVMRDSQTKRSRGFGFVAFDKSECVDLLQSDRPHMLEGKEVDTKRVVPKASSSTQPRSDRELKVQKVFIGGIKDDMTEDGIKVFFGQFGRVDRVETFTDKETGRRKGFGFVTFSDYDAVDKCMLQAQTTPDGKLSFQGHKVEIKKARSQEEMKNSGSSGPRGERGGRSGGRGGGRGGFNDSYGGGRSGRGGAYGDYNQGYNDGYNGGSGYGGGFGGGGDGYGNGYSNGGGGGYGGGSGYGGGGGGGWSGSGGNSNWGGPSGGGGGYGSSGGYGGGPGGGPMRGGHNRNRAGPYGGGGGGAGGWRN